MTPQPGTTLLTATAMATKTERSGVSGVMSESRLLPCDPEAERCVIGSILLDPSCLETITAVLRADDFREERNAALFAALVSMSAGRIPIDLETLRARLRSDKLYDSIGGAASWRRSFKAFRLRHMSFTTQRSSFAMRRCEPLSTRQTMYCGMPTIRADLEDVLSQAERSLSQIETSTFGHALIDSETAVLAAMDWMKLSRNVPKLPAYSLVSNNLTAL